MNTPREHLEKKNKPGLLFFFSRTRLSLCSPPVSPSDRSFRFLLSSQVRWSTSALSLPPANGEGATPMTTPRIQSPVSCRTALPRGPQTTSSRSLPRDTPPPTPLPPTEPPPARVATAKCSRRPSPWRPATAIMFATARAFAGSIPWRPRDP